MEIKLCRAHGGCLGAERRRRTLQTAISFGELSSELRSEDVRMGKPGGAISAVTPERIHSFGRANAEN